MSCDTCNTEFHKGNDGVIRWIYELNMWKNPAIIITTLKVFFLASLAPGILVV